MSTNNTKSKKQGDRYGIFLPTGSKIHYWHRQYKGRSLGGSTGETDRARARQVAKGAYKKAVEDIDAEIASGRKPMTLGRAYELYCAEVVAGKPGADAAARELAWIDSVLGTDTYLHDLTQADITKVRNERRVMTTTRGPAKTPKAARCQSWFRTRRSTVPCRRCAPRSTTCAIIMRRS